MDIVTFQSFVENWVPALVNFLAAATIPWAAAGLIAYWPRFTESFTVKPDDAGAATQHSMASIVGISTLLAIVIPVSTLALAVIAEPATGLLVIVGILAGVICIGALFVLNYRRAQRLAKI